jgi:hypothetical protein
VIATETSGHDERQAQQGAGRRVGARPRAGLSRSGAAAIFGDIRGQRVGPDARPARRAEDLNRATEAATGAATLVSVSAQAEATCPFGRSLPGIVAQPPRSTNSRRCHDEICRSWVSCAAASA